MTNLPQGIDYRFTTHALAGGGQALSLVVVPEARTGLLALLVAPALLLVKRRKK